MKLTFLSTQISLVLFCAFTVWAGDSTQDPIWTGQITWACSARDVKIRNASDCISVAERFFKRAECEYALSDNDIECNLSNEIWSCSVPANKLPNCYAKAKKDDLKISKGNCNRNDVDVLKKALDKQTDDNSLQNVALSFNVTLCRKVLASSLKEGAGPRPINQNSNSIGRKRQSLPLK